MHTASAALLDALTYAGVSYLFANFGSDHPAMLEALAEAAATGRAVPQLVTCPAEMVALCAAQGVTQVTGRAQAVLVHVECGTQSLAGAVHNVARARIPVLIVAGASPFTQGGELPGSRNEFIHWLQDVRDQRGIVRGYVKYDNEIRTGRNLGQLVHRALQIARSEPTGPVYLVAPREVLEETVPPEHAAAAAYAPLAPQALAEADVQLLADALTRAHRPLVVTSYLGRNREAPAALARVCRRLGIGVLESVPGHVNFATDDPLYQGSQWNAQRPNPVLADADVVLVIDSDVPWIPLVNPPRPDAAIYHIDVDPLKPHMPLWHIPARRSFCADAATALGQLAQHLDGIPARRRRGRRAHRPLRRAPRSAAPRAARPRAPRRRRDHPRVPHRVRAAPARRPHHRAQRGHLQLPDHRRSPPAHPPRQHADQRRQLARLERRRRDRRQARRAPITP